MLILITLSGTLLSEELDMDRVMPKKLVYSELPEDYPKELDELFIFYWETVKMLEPYFGDDKKQRESFKEHFDRLSYDKQKHIVYLIWLVSNTIPKYYCEYLSINRNPWDKRLQTLHTWDELDRLSIYPESQRAFYKTNEGLTEGLLPIEEINSCIKWFLKDDPEIYNKDFYPTLWNIWIRARIIDNELVKISDYRGYNYLKLSTIESLGKQFTENEIVLSVQSSPNNYDYIIGKDYLINLCFYMGEGQKAGPPEKLEIDLQKYYTTQASKVFDINNNICKAIRYNIEFCPLKDLMSESREFDYDTFKNIYLEYINNLKGVKNE